MGGVLRTALAALILAFAAGTVLHATRAAAMDLAMAAPCADMPMPGCGGCGGGDDDGNLGPAMTSSCAALCATPPAALPTVPQAMVVPPPAIERVPPLASPAGLTGPPDPRPPRAVVLS